MGAASGILSPVVDFDIAGIPVGRAALLSVGMGAGDVLKALARQVGVPPLVGGLAVAWAVVNVDFIKKNLGSEVAQLWALGILADTINDQINLTKMTTDFLGGLFGVQVVSNSPPQVVNRNANSRARGDLYAGVF